MSKCDLQIKFDREDRTYAGGETVTGRVYIRINNSMKSNGVTLTHQWRTHGRGNVSGGTKETVELEDARSYSPGEELEFSFSLRSPTYPVTYHGTMLNVDHYVSVEVNVPWAFDPKAEEDYVLVPGEPPAHFVGSSNETCWGLMKSLAAAEKYDLCRYDTVQNNFSLINRRCESELAQVCRRENIGLLPFSPLGGGVLTGKYINGDPPGARFTEYRKLGERQQKLADRFLNNRVSETVNRLKVIADDLGITLTAMCVAWSKQHDFVTSTIIGATTVAHLNESLAADGLILDKETLRRIDEIDVAIPNPMKEDGLRRL